MFTLAPIPAFALALTLTLVHVPGAVQHAARGFDLMYTSPRGRLPFTVTASQTRPLCMTCASANLRAAPDGVPQGRGGLSAHRGAAATARQTAPADPKTRFRQASPADGIARQATCVLRKPCRHIKRHGAARTRCPAFSLRGN
eukprot:6200279-Pleurochrysis_carterae.AAC.4